MKQRYRLFLRRKSVYYAFDNETKRFESLKTKDKAEAEEHKIKPHKLRKLRDHERVLVHCEKGFRRITLPPLEPDGTISKWFSWWRQFARKPEK